MWGCSSRGWLAAADRGVRRRDGGLAAGCCGRGWGLLWERVWRRSEPKFPETDTGGGWGWGWGPAMEVDRGTMTAAVAVVLEEGGGGSPSPRAEEGCDQAGGGCLPLGAELSLPGTDWITISCGDWYRITVGPCCWSTNCCSGVKDDAV